MEQFLLQNKLKSIKNKQDRRQYLIDCIHKHKPMKNLLKMETEIEQNYNKICEYCKHSDFVLTKYEEICQNCNLVRPILGTERTYNEKKFDTIQTKKNIVKIDKDGKKISVDLNQISLWIQEKDPFSKDIKLINDTLDNLTTIYDIDIIKRTCSALYYYANELNNKLNNEPINRKNKKGFIGLCIYYSGIINSIKINLKTISELLDINIVNIYKANDLFQELFKTTQFEYLKLELEIKCNIELNDKNKLLFNKIKLHLINKKIITESVSNKFYAGIIYYISNKINKSVKYTLQDLSKKCEISTTLISETYKLINSFYTNNNNLLINLKSGI